MEDVCLQACSRPQVEIMLMYCTTNVRFHTHTHTGQQTTTRTDDECDDSDNDMDDDGMYLDDDGDDYEGGEDDDVRIMMMHQKQIHNPCKAFLEGWGIFVRLPACVLYILPQISTVQILHSKVWCIPEIPPVPQAK